MREENYYSAKFPFKAFVAWYLQVEESKLFEGSVDQKERGEEYWMLL